MVMQFLVNSIVAGAGIALVAISFSVIYSTTRFFHFAHGGVYLVGGYAAYSLMTLAGLPPLASTALALIIAALTGCLVEVCVYSPLRKRGASALSLLLASIGLFITLENLVSLCFGDTTVK